MARYEFMTGQPYIYTRQIREPQFSTVECARAPAGRSLVCSGKRLSLYTNDASQLARRTQSKEESERAVTSVS
jgi:hypothetical protein